MEKRIGKLNGPERAVALAVWVSLLCACDSGPKAVPASTENEGGTGSTGVFSDGAAAPQQGSNELGPGVEKELHTVVALEALPTSKYVYVRVKEGEEEFWVAAMKQDVAIGRSYFYRGGLLKTDFHSTEYKRTFDKVYLISQLVPSDHGGAGGGMGMPSTASPGTPAMGGASTPVEGAEPVKVAALVADPKKFEGKAVRLTGKVAKVNPNIMGRNWIHLKDGSKDDYDLVITCALPLPEGKTVTMVGTVVLGKDFGSGYNYDILLENGTLVE
ncbi:MAG: hypothetical protein IPP33_11010 [Flavobacteriales bacterium]|nr:hypothetical protein [Flavobacteriales bacterium]